MDGERETDGDFARQLLATLQQQLTMAMETNARSSEAITRQTELSRSLAEEIARRPASGATPAATTEATAADYEAMFDDPEFEAQIFARAEEEGWLDPDSGLALEALEHHVSALAEMTTDYLAYCARKDLDPASAVPSLWFVAKGVAAAFEQVGVAPPTARQASPRIEAPARRKGRPTATRRPAGQLLSEAFNDYIALKCDGYRNSRNETPNPQSGASFAGNSKPNFVGTMRLAVRILGDRPIADIAEKDWRAFMDVIVRLPYSHGKSANETRDPQTIADELDAEEQRAMEEVRSRLTAANTKPQEIDFAVAQQRRRRLSANACDKHVGRIINVLDYAKQRGLLETNMMAQLRWGRAELNERARTQAVKVVRKPWRDKIYDLFRTPVFQGGLTHPGDPLFWAPLLGELAGLRQEEALQLRLHNFQSDQGIAFIQVGRTDDAQNEKNETSGRCVPLHRHLVDLGLLELVAMMKAEGNRSLFPDQTRGRTKSKLSENFTKRFSYYRGKAGVYEPGMDFHSLRTGFQQRLKAQGVPKEIRQELIGHKRDAIIDVHYDREPTPIPILKKHVDLIELDVSMIKSPFAQKTDDETPRLRLVR